MKEKQVIAPKAILLFVAAFLLLGVGVLFATPITEDLFGLNFDQLIIGFLLLIGGSIFLLKDFKSMKKDLKYLTIIELVFVVIISLYGFILPEFVDDLKALNLSVNVYLGFLVIFHGISTLVVERFNETKMPLWKLVAFGLLVAAGGLILDSRTLQVGIIIKVFVVGLCLLLATIVLLKALKLPKVTKQVKDKAEESEESKNA
ncbi:hypothetical protein JV173_03145 [Acholeplasma equirhinis]|uniref:hypothetical protein n=1 Tax=Acholeplasma equirhinis TaxID=555393 RepID=UPI00197AC619|nr:hypothetical protein [Acholeplasma equirhinis]MBN3490505.1 hypothetical protein [Acholeplasma equirhinis]